jgi:hypothetical protein
MFSGPRSKDATSSLRGSLMSRRSSPNNFNKSGNLERKNQRCQVKVQNILGDTTQMGLVVGSI